MAKDGKDGALTPTTRRLIDAAAGIMGEPDPTDRDRAFMARQLVQATLPHSDPGNVPIWTRTNGRLTLAVRPYYDRQQQRHLHPYGTVPRLLLFWLTTEAVRTRMARVERRARSTGCRTCCYSRSWLSSAAAIHIAASPPSSTCTAVARTGPLA
jgi:hypothetical protein